MAEVRGRKSHSHSTVRSRAPSAQPASRPALAMVHTTQWQRYLDRIRRLVRLSLHP